jgi:Bromodomain
MFVVAPPPVFCALTMADASTETVNENSAADTKREALEQTNSKSMEVSEMIAPSLFRLTEGLPRKELEVMLSEAKDCEAALEKEIKQLEEASQSKETSNEAAVSIMLASEITPPDRYYSVSALMGRLRDPLSVTPLWQQAQQGQMAQQIQPTKKKKPATPVPGDDKLRLIERQKLLLSLDKHPEYRAPHVDSTQLLATWKRISAHRTATVFRRPVNPKEAPGYQHRILFPIDLSLIRKMLTAGMITSYADLHQRIGLICHNCVKFNGYQSDYAVVARDFETHVDEVMVQTVTSVQTPAPQAITTPEAVGPVPSTATTAAPPLTTPAAPPASTLVPPAPAPATTAPVSA